MQRLLDVSTLADWALVSGSSSDSPLFGAPADEQQAESCVRAMLRWTAQMKPTHELYEITNRYLGIMMQGLTTGRIRSCARSQKSVIGAECAQHVMHLTRRRHR